ncbi:hypothetical protein FQN60_013255 [Etheostoma spectabile]|uniref:Uncharacterized protein n=1 Tax=Etheostoma spectabile TaxID=54343 RepID=A0A5J5DAJ6_9PERO|nr:hypothetical protein FQN60_013255 [Etheostoma spectabile]
MMMMMMMMMMVVVVVKLYTNMPIYYLFLGASLTECPMIIILSVSLFLCLSVCVSSRVQSVLVCSRDCHPRGEL